MPDQMKPTTRLHPGWRVFGWVVLGGLVGTLLTVAFLAYAQPELLLEQINLRYCG